MDELMDQDFWALYKRCILVHRYFHQRFKVTSKMEALKEMREEEYKEEILRTYMGSENKLDKLCLGALGLTGEAGEVADIIKKILFHKHPIDAEKLREELGDVLWYLLLICDALGYTLEDIMEYNVQKLNKRYPNNLDTKRS